MNVKCLYQTWNWKRLSNKMLDVKIIHCWEEHPHTFNPTTLIIPHLAPRSIPILSYFGGLNAPT